MQDNVDPRLFGENLCDTAEYRRRKAEEYPDDSRNAEAADLLDRLALEFGKLTQADLAPLGRALGTYDMSKAEMATYYISRVGFDHFPTDAKELVCVLAGFIERMSPDWSEAS